MDKFEGKKPDVELRVGSNLPDVEQRVGSKLKERNLSGKEKIMGSSKGATFFLSGTVCSGRRTTRSMSGLKGGAKHRIRRSTSEWGRKKCSTLVKLKSRSESVNVRKGKSLIRPLPSVENIKDEVEEGDPETGWQKLRDRATAGCRKVWVLSERKDPQHVQFCRD